MTAYEYKVVPAPTKGKKTKGAKTAADRFAHALEVAMNELGAEGWDYVRADTLPSEEREGIMGKTTVYQNMLVFRRLRADVADETPVEEPPVTQILTPLPASPAAPLLVDHAPPAPEATVPPVTTDERADQSS